jgi:hypothetical protein
MLKKLSGQSLIEVIVVVALASTVLVGLVVLGNVALRNVSITGQRSDAIKMATASIEAVRYVRDTDAVGCGFDSLFNNTTKESVCYKIENDAAACGASGACVCSTLVELSRGTACSTAASSSWVQIPIPGTSLFYRRMIRVEGIDTPADVDSFPDDNLAKVHVVIQWDENTGVSETKLSSVIANTN